MKLEKNIFLSQARLFSLVKDVQAYPSFVPGVHHAVISPTEDENIFYADLLIKKGLLSFSYRSCVTCCPFSNIQVSGISGPFRHLHGQWRFIPLGSCETRVIFSLDVSFQSFLFSTPLSHLLQGFFQDTLQAFEARAKSIYVF